MFNWKSFAYAIKPLAVISLLACPLSAFGQNNEPVADEAILEGLPKEVDGMLSVRVPESTMVVYRNPEHPDHTKLRIRAITHNFEIRDMYLVGMAQFRIGADSSPQSSSRIRTSNYREYSGYFFETYSDQGDKIDGPGTRLLWLLRSGTRLLDVYIVVKDSSKVVSTRKAIEQAVFGTVSHTPDEGSTK